MNAKYLFTFELNQFISISQSHFLRTFFLLLPYSKALDIFITLLRRCAFYHTNLIVFIALHGHISTFQLCLCPSCCQGYRRTPWFTSI